MEIDLRAELPVLRPLAIAWAETIAAEVARDGLALDDEYRTLASNVGVQQPKLICVKLVESMPLPEDLYLRAAALQAGVLGSDFDGLTFGHSVLIREGRVSKKLLSHEFRHVYQYEQQGGIAEFLSIHLPQVVNHGYRNSPFEIDARNHEVD